MKAEYFCNLSIEQLIDLFKALSESELHLFAQSIELEQLSSLVIEISKKHKGFEGKLFELIIQLKNHTKLELVAENLTAKQIVDLLNVSKLKDKDSYDTISALLVGMNEEKFFAVLHNMTEELCQFMAQTALAEPLQHRLTLFVKEVEIKETEVLKQLEIASQLANEKDLEDSENDLKTFLKQVVDLIEICKKASKLAWNTNRLDLIENFNRLKLQLDHTLLALQGTGERNESNLFWVIEKKKQSLAKEDELPVTESLSHFSIWYLSDYWKLGLLPNVTEEKIVNCSKEAHDEFLEIVYQNLNKLHLKTAGDLKKQEIHSKEDLQAYILKNKHLL